MKFILLFLISFFSYCFAISQNNKDSLKEITTIGIFKGDVINKYGYKINEYYISINDISNEQVDFYKGKKVAITGILKVEEEKNEKSNQSTNDIKKYILNPKFSIIYNSREPLIDKEE